MSDPSTSSVSGLVAAVNKTAVVLKKFLASDLGRKVHDVHGREKFDQEITPLLDLMAKVIDHIKAKGSSAEGLVQGPLAEVYSGDYYGDLSGVQALNALTTEILSLENRMQTRSVENFYD